MRSAGIPAGPRGPPRVRAGGEKILRVLRGSAGLGADLSRGGPGRGKKYELDGSGPGGRGKKDTGRAGREIYTGHCRLVTQVIYSELGHI